MLQSRRRFLQSTALSLGATPAVLADTLKGTGEMSSPTAEDCFALLDEGRRIPVVFDTDIGDDIDDTWALLYLLKCPELDVRLISCESPRGQYRARIVARFLEAVGRTDIPIAMGRNGAGTGRQRDWSDGYDLANYPGTLIEDSASAIVETINESETPTTVIGIGPVPVVAEAARKDPWIGRKARFVGMHGSVFLGYKGKPDPEPEYNVRVAPEALRTVLEAEWEPTLTPIDTCGLFDLRGDRYQTVLNSDAAGIAELMDNYRVWIPRAKWVQPIDPDRRSTTLFDIVAVTLAFTEKWLQMETLPIEVTDDGSTVVNREDGRPTRLALKWRDLDGYADHVVERLTGPIIPNA